MKTTIKQYIELTKPGIIRGNIITAIAGFLLASTLDNFSLEKFLAMIVGLSLIIASGCIVNNFIDRGIDKKMERTKKRALAANNISAVNALIYATITGLLGCITLGIFTNSTTLYLGIAGFVFYVFVYGVAKRKTVYGTEIGSISGAIPPVVGYTAVTSRIDLAAAILFIILVTWQMPHFYAIATYRLKDYKSAGIPVLPAVKGIKITKLYIMIYIGLFFIASLCLSIFGYTGIIYSIIMIIVGLIWFIWGLRNYSTDSKRWAKKMYVYSLLGTMGFLAAILADFLTR